MARGGQLGTSQPQDDAQLFSTDKKALLEFVRCDIPRDSSTQNPLIVLAKGCLQMGSPCLGAPRSTGGAKRQHRVCHSHPQPSQSRVSWASLTWGTWGMKSPQGHPCRTVSNLQQPNVFPKHKIIQLFHVQVWNSQVWSVEQLGLECHTEIRLHHILSLLLLSAFGFSLYTPDFRQLQRSTQNQHWIFHFPERKV